MYVSDAAGDIVRVHASPHVAQTNSYTGQFVAACKAASPRRIRPIRGELYGPCASATASLSVSGHRWNTHVSDLYVKKENISAYASVYGMMPPMNGRVLACVCPRYGSARPVRECDALAP